MVTVGGWLLPASQLVSIKRGAVSSGNVLSPPRGQAALILWGHSESNQRTNPILISVYMPSNSFEIQYDCLFQPQRHNLTFLKANQQGKTELSHCKWQRQQNCMHQKISHFVKVKHIAVLISRCYA